MSWLEKWSWKPETPGKVPAGARISAGKSGKVLTSLPKAAETLVNWVPTSCMPSPESPQKRMTAESSSSKIFVDGEVVVSRDAVDCIKIWSFNNHRPDLHLNSMASVAKSQLDLSDSILVRRKEFSKAMD